MKIFASTVLLLATSAVSSVALAQEGEGRRLAALTFSSLDTAERGYVDQGEFTTFGGDVFYSMDSDDDDKLSLSEFLNWDFGMRPVAIEAGREAAYETALRVVFAFWDQNGDGLITRTEHRRSMNADFRRADADNDAVLTQDEFIYGFSVMVALRAAINPVPIQN